MKDLSKTFFCDHVNGKKAEELSLPALQTLTKYPLFHIEDIYAPWDFESSGTVIEHKFRECFFTDYQETMINAHKIDRAYETNKKVFYAFRFKDGLYIIKFKKQLFDTFKRETFKIKDRIDYKEKYQERIFIPTHLLTCLEKFNFSPPCLIQDI